MSEEEKAVEDKDKGAETVTEEKKTEEPGTDLLPEDQIKCPFCAETIQKGALYCKHCHQWLDGRQQLTREQITYGNERWPSQFLFMYLCSFGLYYIWWSYKNWCQLRDFRKLPIGPRKRTLGLFAPLISIYFIYLQFFDIDEAAKSVEIENRTPIEVSMIAYIALNAFIVSVLGQMNHSSWALLVYLFSIVGLAYVFYRSQSTLNEYWQKVQPDLPMKKNWSIGQAVVIVLGGFYFVVMLLLAVSGILSGH